MLAICCLDKSMQISIFSQLIYHIDLLSFFIMDKQKLVNMLKQCGAIQFGHFVLTSGAVSEYYIDIKKASTNAKTLKAIAEEMASYTKEYDLLAGMELGAVPLVVALSLETTIPYVIVRKEKRSHGTGKQIEGETVENKKVLIIEDVTTSGGSVLKTINALRTNKAQVDRVLVVVDRESGAKEKIQKVNVDFMPLLTVSDILER